VQIGDEPRFKRFVVNTSETEIDKVEGIIKQKFAGKLAVNSVTAADVTEISPTAKSGPAAGELETPPPLTGDQTRNDLPDDSVLAIADEAAVLLAQADPAAGDPPASDAAGEAPAEEKSAEEKQADASAESEPAKAADESAPAPDAEPAAEQPAAEAAAEPAMEPAVEEKPAVEPAEETAAPAEQPAATTPVEKTAATAGAPELVDPFVGGTVAVLTFGEKVSYDTVMELFAEHFGSEAAIPRMELTNPDYVDGSNSPYNTWQIKTVMPPGQANEVFEAIEADLAASPYFPSSSTIGGKVAGSTRSLAVAALVASLIGIVAYIWVRFQRVVYGLAAVVALVHDVSVTLGVIALSAYLADYVPGAQSVLLIDPFKIGLPALAAFLTIIGYSLNDTIVVFDRIREVRGKTPRLTEEMVNVSVNQTLSRTILTSATTLIVVLILYMFGGQGIHGFAFALVIGVLVGTYSSIFIASPILIWMNRPAGSRQSDAK